MASLGEMLAGSALGQGAANFVQGQAQGAMDRFRMDQLGAQQAQQQKVWDFHNNQMDRTLQDQQIDSTPTDGGNDADRLDQLADIAGEAGRGDLQRKYQGLASQARTSLQMQGIANASRAITLGQFGPAAQLLNQTGIFGQIHSIGLADDVEQDPRNPTYSVYTGGAPDAQGNPTQGPHVHVTQQMLYQLQSSPQDALHWMAYSQAQGQKADATDRRLDQKDTQLQETERHNRALEAARRAGAAGAGGRLTDSRWRYHWAVTPAEQGGGGMAPKDAMAWASDPQKDSRAYWNSMKVAGQVANSGGLFSADDITKIAAALRGTPLANPGGNGTGGGGNGTGNRLASLGAKPVPGREKEGVYADARGRHFKMQGTRILQWSPSGQQWVDVTDRIPAR